MKEAYELLTAIAQDFEAQGFPVPFNFKTLSKNKDYLLKPTPEKETFLRELILNKRKAPFETCKINNYYFLDKDCFAINFQIHYSTPNEPYEVFLITIDRDGTTYILENIITKNRLTDSPDAAKEIFSWQI